MISTGLIAAGPRILNRHTRDEQLLLALPVAAGPRILNRYTPLTPYLIDFNEVYGEFVNVNWSSHIRKLPIVLDFSEVFCALCWKNGQYLDTADR